MEELARAYLRRIGLREALGPDEMANAHRRAMCSTNWRMASRPLPTDERALVERLARPGSGGHAIELNAAFAWLLRALGHEASLAADALGAPVVRLREGQVWRVLDVGRVAPVPAADVDPCTLASFAGAWALAAASSTGAALRALRANEYGWDALHGKMHRWKGATGEGERPLLGWEVKDVLRGVMGLDVDAA